MKTLLAATETVAAVFLLLIALLTTTNVLSRELLGVTIPDWFDGSQLLLGVALFWGMAIASYRGGHICVDILWEHLGPPNRRRLDILAAAVCAAFLLPLAWMVWVKVGGVGTQSTSDLRLPLLGPYAIAAAGISCGALLACARLIELLMNHVRGEEEQHGS
ncbi:TRAP transporter small permease [Azoarcus sp. PA01]|nr:TRAP transporter small permease [Azoarcus sp. PA01]KON82552.1 TRAP transporter small permease [Azoarcus sp. PA01]